MSICVACLFRDSDIYLKEFIEYYLRVGVTHFYLGNNLSKDDYMRILYPYILKGVVTLFEVGLDDPYNFEWRIHSPFYRQIIELCKDKVQWLLCIDSDEFIVPVKHNTLGEALEEYKGNAAVAVNWHLYGTTLETKSKDTLLIKECLYRAKDYIPEHFNVKHIVNPSRVRFNDVHNVDGLDGYPVTLTNGRKPHNTDDLDQQRVPTDVLVINHYNIGTIEYYNKVKVPFYEKYVSHDCKDREAILSRANDKVELDVYDPCILRFASHVEKAIRCDPFYYEPYTCDSIAVCVIGKAIPGSEIIKSLMSCNVYKVGTLLDKEEYGEINIFVPSEEIIHMIVTALLNIKSNKYLILWDDWKDCKGVKMDQRISFYPRIRDEWMNIIRRSGVIM